MQITFYGAAQTVTGSKHLIELTSGKKILLDCGLFQGLGKQTAELNRHFGLNPQSIDVVLLSHAHIDHSGLIPRLVKEGFKGKIICTPATFDVCKILLMDSAHIQEDDITFINKKRQLEGKEPVKPLYTVNDALESLKHFETVPFNTPYTVFDDVELTFTEVGHILGSGAINLIIRKPHSHKTIRLCYTGDIGRYKSCLMNDPQPFPQADYIICESTYGNRLHENTENTEAHLLNTIIETCIHKKGKLIIPAFSLGRTQEIIYALNKLDLFSLLPDIKIFIDSPLSTSATEIYRKHVYELNEDVKKISLTDPDPFGFEKLHYITDKKYSQYLNNIKEPCVIISAGGMADAGRVKHHIMHNVEKSQNTILLVGYAEPNSLAGLLRNGSKEVRIFGDKYKVNAKIEVLDGMSAHGDYNEMIRFLSCQNKNLVKDIFLVHGNLEACEAFAQKLKTIGFKNITIPEKGKVYTIN